ncbi:hypothetical protein CONLIGDRAFT_645991 [Coniochaeta ligniaria NRRL 30616]|uniref:Uncharacterized protein n=1 Tax=Coniochaeta ligniaria NRRL 30616 TaxID=1408157 RepID=A0A1J7J388_9PEZI|nr:hypothetical protein CONLIGDRAFT_645991 [Coniochaeta ligniaria NRRL 30616]
MRGRQNDTATVAPAPSTTPHWDLPGVPADNLGLFTRAPPSSSATPVSDPRRRTRLGSRVAAHLWNVGSTPASPIGQPPPQAMGTATTTRHSPSQRQLPQCLVPLLLR